METGVHASGKLQLNVLLNMQELSTCPGEGAADTFQTLLTCQREGGPSLLPGSPWFRVQGTQLIPGEVLSTDC